MKKIIILAIAAMTVSSCDPAPHEKYHVGKHRVYHFDDGRVGYRDDETMLWYYLVNPKIDTTTPTLSGGWAIGLAPSSTDINDAIVENQGVVEAADGEPVDVAESTAIEAANPSIAESTVEAPVGDIAATVEFGVSAEGTANAPASDGGFSSGDSGGGGGGE